MKVVTLRGNSGYKYHRMDDNGEPVCFSKYDETANWKEWDKEVAEAWREPCQREKCFGEPQEHFKSIKLHD